MSKYEELSEQYSAYVAAENAYIVQVTGVAGSVADNFDAYLGLARRDTAVVLGIGSERNFREVSWQDLPCTNGVVDFSIDLILQTPNKLSRIDVVFELSVFASAGTYTFNVDTFPKPVILSELEVSERQFGKIYDLLSERIRETLNPKRYQF